MVLLILISSFVPFSISALVVAAENDDPVYHIELNANGGECAQAFVTISAEQAQYGDLPSAEKAGWTFIGWFTAKQNGVRAKTTDAVSSDMTLYAKYARSMVVTSLPNRTIYSIGETADLTGAQVCWNCADGVLTEPLWADVFAVVPKKFSTLGDQQVYLFFDSMSTSFPVSVQELTVQSIDVSSHPQKTTYYIDEMIQTDGMAIDIHYSNGTVSTVHNGFTCSPLSFSTAGTKIVNVSYLQHSTTFSVQILCPEPIALTVKSSNLQTKYCENDKLRTEGIRLFVTYNNGQEKQLTDFSNVEFSYDFSIIGNQVVSVQYTEDGKTLSTYFTVEVCETPIVCIQSISNIDPQTVKATVRVEQNCGLAGFKMLLEYDDSIFKPSQVTAGEVLNADESGFLNSNIGVDACNPVQIVWSGTKDVSADGTLFEVFFSINEQLVGLYNFSLSYEPFDTFDEHYNSIALQCSSAVFEITEDSFGTTEYILLRNQTCLSGEKLDVPLFAWIQPSETEKEIKFHFDPSIFTVCNVSAGLAEVIRTEHTAETGSLSVWFTTKQQLQSDVAFILSFETATTAAGVFNLDIESSDIFKSRGCTITIEDGEATHAPMIVADDVHLQKGTTEFTVPIMIQGNCGLMGIKCYLSYGNEVQLVRAECGKAFQSGSLTTNIQNESGSAILLWNHVDAIYENGTLFWLHFEVQSTFEQRETILALTINKEDTFDENWKSVDLNSIDVVIHMGRSGDANEDGDINLQDVVLITRWLAGGWNVTVNQINADVNRDGFVDLKDVVIIRRFLAGGWGVELR